MSTRWVQVPKRRRTKIVATADVVESDEETFGQIIRGGANLIRLPIDPAARAATEQAYGALRAAAHNARNPVGVIADLAAVSGPDQLDAVRFLVELGVDYLAVTHHAGQLLLDDARSWLPSGSPTILARIVRAESLVVAGNIIEAADGVIVDLDCTSADADLAPEDAPVVCRRLVALARERGKPSLLAATAVEATAVVLTGADAVILSTPALGGDAIADIETVDSVARRLEADLEDDGLALSSVPNLVWSPDGALVRAAAQLARDVDARAVVVLPSVRSGFTARALSSHRPTVPVVGLALTLPAMLQMSVLWGVIPRWVRPDELAGINGPGGAVTFLRTMAGQLDLGAAGDLLVTIDGLGDSDAATDRRLTVVTL